MNDDGDAICLCQVGSLSAEWLAEERTRVVGTFPPRKKGWTGLVEKDTAGQTNIYSVEVTQPNPTQPNRSNSSLGVP